MMTRLRFRGDVKIFYPVVLSYQSPYEISNIVIYTGIYCLLTGCPLSFGCHPLLVLRIADLVVAVDREELEPLPSLP